MAKNLIIVESPTKEKTLKKFLGSSFEVKASKGHFRDLPKLKLGVNIEKNFEPTYEIMADKKNVVEDLKAAAKSADTIYLAPDPDREGEAIAWHLMEILTEKSAAKGKKIYRVQFNEITKDAVKNAIDNPREIDIDKVNAQQARRILDRLVGFKLSPLLGKKIYKGLSAGRVQSATLRLIIERENEIAAFMPKEYWSVDATANKDKAKFPTSLHSYKTAKANDQEIADKKTIDAILEAIKKSTFNVSEVKKQKRSKTPPPPYITASLQREAANAIGFSPTKTMKIAQELYEGVSIGKDTVGLITYMRTDSTRIADEAKLMAIDFITDKYGKDYLSANKPKKTTKKENVQDAHEAIRPTYLSYEPDQIKTKLTADQHKLYKLIYNKFLASQMANAEFEIFTIELANQKKELVFKSSSSKVTFQGYRAVLADEDEKVVNLPELKEGDEVKLTDVSPEQHFTEPPPHFNESSIIKELEELGIGRPSTYAPTIETLIKRQYVNKEDKKLIPTDIGRQVDTLLVGAFPNIVDSKFTAQMEEELDKVATGKMKWTKILDEFYGPFEKLLKKADVEIKKEVIITDKVCSKCGSPMALKTGRYGKFYACTAFPKCKNTMPYEEEGEGGTTKPKEELEASGEICELCGGQMLIRKGRYGPFLGCSNYPDCKNMKPIKRIKDIACPECEKEGRKGLLVERKSFKGRKSTFYACNQYPTCKFILNNKPTGEKCKTCGSLMVEAVTKDGNVIKCSNTKCETNKKK